MSESVYGVYNGNEFYSYHYVSEVLASALAPVIDRWNERSREDENFIPPYRRSASLRQHYLRNRERGVEAERPMIQAIMGLLGYEYRVELVSLDGSEDHAVLPAVARSTTGDGKPHLWVLEAYPEPGDPPLDARPLEAQYSAALPAGASRRLSETFEEIISAGNKRCCRPILHSIYPITSTAPSGKRWSSSGASKRERSICGQAASAAGNGSTGAGATSCGRSLRDTGSF